MMPVSASTMPFSITTPPLALGHLTTKFSLWLYLTSCTACAVNLFRGQESRRGRRQKNYSDTFAKLLCSAITQLVEPSVSKPATNNPRSSKLIPKASSTFDFRQKIVLDKSRIATRVFVFPSLFRAILAIDAHWSNTTISENLKGNHDYYVAELVVDFEILLRFG